MTDARRDPSCVFPLQTMRELASRGVIGEVAPTVHSVMGANYSIKKTSSVLGLRTRQPALRAVPSVRGRAAHAPLLESPHASTR